jgi:hypothetical protein
MFLSGRLGQGICLLKRSEQQKKRTILFVQSGTETQHPGNFEFLTGIILNETKKLQGTANAFYLNKKLNLGSLAYIRDKLHNVASNVAY